MDEKPNNIFEIVEKLQHGEKVLCEHCKKKYYDVNFPNREHSNYFHCEDPNCKGFIHIQKAIDVE